jgi:eukaryotic-like serine/threonine-protein kinase
VDAGDRPSSLPSHLQLVREIGRGGSATVWQARDRRSGVDVAVKVLSLRGVGGVTSEREGFERFEHEARALARLDGHPGVLTVRALGVGDDGVGWIVTELLPGDTLADRLAEGPCRPDDVIETGMRLADALAAAHAAEVVHGDVTPANVLFRADGGAVLSDFGLALVQVGGGGTDGTGRGLTPAYAAPERRGGGAPTAASDVHGLGATLLAAATGSTGMTGRPVPRGLDAILGTCVATDPSGRPSAAELVRLLGGERRRRGRARRG